MSEATALPPHWQRFDRASLVATPWKNGGGLTREIVCQPPEADLARFDWRVSIAHIASDGPFSAFPGVDRVITLLEGGGVQLDSSDGSVAHCLGTPWQPFAFAGEARIDSRLLGGPCEDFNVMTRRAACRATVRVLRAGGLGAEVDPTPSAGLGLVLQGRWQLGPSSTDGAGTTLSPGQGLWWSGGPGPQPGHCADADATLLWVTIHPVLTAKE